MNETSEIIHYLIKNYPYPLEMSVKRIMMSLYLIDWKSSIEYGRQLSSIKWKIKNHWLSDKNRHQIGNILFYSKCFKEENRIYSLNDMKEFGSHGYYYEFIDREEFKVIDHVIEHSRSKYDIEVETLIRSTYPFINYDYIEFKEVDLVMEAKKYGIKYWSE